jgi:hypothetical protein
VRALKLIYSLTKYFNNGCFAKCHNHPRNLRLHQHPTPHCSTIKGEQPTELLPFVGNERLNMPNGLMFSVKDYIVLVEDTGRIIREDKRGSISSSSLDILNRRNIPAENWLKITTEFGALFKGAVGVLPALSEYCEHLDRKRRQGVVKLPARVVCVNNHI